MRLYAGFAMPRMKLAKASAKERLVGNWLKREGLLNDIDQGKSTEYL